MVHFWDFVVTIFGFAAIIELAHFLPFARAITDELVYSRMYNILPAFLLSFLFFEMAYLLDLFTSYPGIHSFFEAISMGFVLLAALFVIRKNTAEFQVISVTKDVLEKSEKRYRTLIETMNDGFWGLDTNSITTIVNRRLCEMLGYTEEEMIGESVFNFLDKENKSEVKTNLDLRKRGVSTTYEIEIIKKDGSKLPVLVSGSPYIDDDGILQGANATITDMSKRKEMEAQIQKYYDNLENLVDERTAELTKARDSLVNMLEDLTESRDQLAKAYDDLKDVDRLKTDIISNISHELRTPITIAKSAMELTREEEDSTEREKFLEMSENALIRLNNIVENIVNISSIYKGQYTIQTKPLILNSLIDDVLKDFQAMAGEQKISLRFKPKKESIKVLGDRESLKWSLKNLVDNAIKFNHEGGTVEIKAEENKGFALISVRDTGIGIDPEHKETIFEPFYQIDPTTTRKYGGTGVWWNRNRSLFGEGPLRRSEGKGLGREYSRGRLHILP
jgi:PAS domain S-box-containing protein